MGMASHLGPWLLGTVKNTTGTSAGQIRNMGATIVAQTYTAPSSVMLTSANNPVAQAMFTLPAGAKIVRFDIEVSTTITGATNVGVQIGTSSSAAFYMASVNSGLTANPSSPVTIANATAADKLAIGTTDATIYGTFTAAGANATAGNIVVTVEYIVRNSDGSVNPAYNQA